MKFMCMYDNQYLSKLHVSVDLFYILENINDSNLMELCPLNYDKLI